MSLIFALFVILRFLFNIMESGTESNDILGERLQKGQKLNYYWNVPTFQCDSHKLNFSGLAEKYGIIQNENDRFRGNEIVILYDPGNFPALLKDGSKMMKRNGGVPQEGNLTLHLTLFEELLTELIPEDFSGLGIIDFESWRPIYRQNFGSLSPYKDLSVEIERQSHPFWPKFLLEKEATRRFEFHARKFMEETLFVAKNLRKNATWGYYAYPYCFNMSPNNMKVECPNEVQKENDRLEWLFQMSDNLHPSIYFDGRLSAKEKIQMIEGRINEAHRVATYVKTRTHRPKIVPYFWYKYHGGQVFLTKEDLFNAVLTLSTSDIDGVVIWGSSNDVNTKNKCLDLYEYVDNVLGPSLVNNF
ncbi:hyaluronidase-like [Tribolium madens]|uniref:hyaluronidase-like n=1 Tax=Tribolium madens TaxID=41895 RepID=UPI001CF723F9|nr:hyaluronidase-like [Tribolium madens]